MRSFREVCSVFDLHIVEYKLLFQSEQSVMALILPQMPESFLS